MCACGSCAYSFCAVAKPVISLNFELGTFASWTHPSVEFPCREIGSLCVSERNICKRAETRLIKLPVYSWRKLHHALGPYIHVRAT